MFLHIMRRMVRAQNSTTSPEFRLNSPFHSVPVKGDYKLSKKNEILVDLFLNTLFHTVPPQSPLPPSPSFLPTKFARSFQFLFWIPASLPTGSPRVRGQVRGHLAGPRRPTRGTRQQRALLLGSCRLVPNFHLRPPSPLASLRRKPLQGCFNGRRGEAAVSARSTEAAKFGCCHEGSHTGRSSARERWEIKGGDAPLPRLADKGDLYGHRPMRHLVWSWGYIFKNVPLEEPFYCSSNRFSVGQ